MPASGVRREGIIPSPCGTKKGRPKAARFDGFDFDGFGGEPRSALPIAAFAILLAAAIALLLLAALLLLLLAFGLALLFALLIALALAVLLLVRHVRSFLVPERDEQ
ncbi:hypothetical protein BHE75_04262 [Sphingomonas haloaromaticamans]|uniref:Uncharacterized protein n=1 Tax=Edaphosphingomonas haloaromaticamans TaxID=653954 RepID=A0A1S1HJL8_9SPHN|nr:hypothetical protein BHE75_04262 [Sphingomonas haloaromaticamans]